MPYSGGVLAFEVTPPLTAEGAVVDALIVITDNNRYRPLESAYYFSIKVTGTSANKMEAQDEEPLEFTVTELNEGTQIGQA